VRFFSRILNGRVGIRTIIRARQEFLGRGVYLLSELVRDMHDHERRTRCRFGEVERETGKTNKKSAIFSTTL
jgi:hypothetical protein